MELTTCETCGAILNVGDFPFCGGDPSKHRQQASGVIQDSYEGGVWIENLGPVPVKVYSNTERLKIMRERGLSEFVRHTPVPGTDKSPHTSDWSKGIDAYTLAAATELVSRAGAKSTETPEPDVAYRPFNVTGTKRDAVTILKLLEGR